jgi:DNA topoisomerase-3
MLQLVRHFGDQNDSGTPCGLCDVCAPSTSTAQVYRPATAQELDAATRTLEALRIRDGRATGQLHRDLFGESAFDRRALENVLAALVRRGHVTVAQDEFVKDGTTIAFQRVHLARESAPLTGLEMVVVSEPAKTKRPWRPRRSTKSKGTTKRRPPRRKKTTKRTT